MIITDEPDNYSDGTARSRADQMKRLSDDERRNAIGAARDVIGFGRFVDRSRQRQLETAYRRPSGGGVA